MFTELDREILRGIRDSVLNGEIATTEHLHNFVMSTYPENGLYIVATRYVTSPEMHPICASFSYDDASDRYDRLPFDDNRRSYLFILCPKQLEEGILPVKKSLVYAHLLESVKTIPGQLPLL